MNRPEPEHGAQASYGEGRRVWLRWHVPCRNRPTQSSALWSTALAAPGPATPPCVACPAHADRTPSLSVRQGDRGILVTCHAGCDARDVLRELARIERLPDFRRAIVEKATGGPGEAHLAIWRAANAIEGTLAERYIRDTRGIWAPLNDLRFHPRCPRGQGAFARFEPALLVAMRKLGEIAAIQRIFLDPGTAPRPKSSVSGRQLGRPGPMGLPLETIGLCEGFETAAAYMSLTGIQAWATMGAKRFHQLTIPQRRDG
jgi:hypothetical protein